MSTDPSPRDVNPGVQRRPKTATAAARLATSRVRALGCLVAGGILLPATLAAFWLKSGRLSGRAIAVAVGVSTLVALLGVVQLIVRRRAMQRHRARAAAKGGAPGTPLQVHFCKRSLGRLGPGVTPLLSGLRERGHTPVVRECLNCCQDCNLGMLVTMVDGTPMSATDGTKLLRDLDELAAAES